MPSLSEATAIRLFNSVVATDGPAGGTTPLAPTILPAPLLLPATSEAGGVVVLDDCRSLESLRSSNDLGNSCRICRWNRSDMQVLRCPCLCKGSVGFIHMQCLKRWIMHRRDNRCEICNSPFEMPDEKVNLRRLLRSFLYTRCAGSIMKHLLFSASLIPLAHVVLQQVGKLRINIPLRKVMFELPYLQMKVLLCMDNINQSSNVQLTVPEVLIASAALLTSSALFFHFFEFITTRFLLIRSILRQWWMFGNASDFQLVELDNDSFEIF